MTYEGIESRMNEVHEKNPLGMIPDPYAGDTFVFPATPCSDQRRLWFRRCNEIMGFLNLTEMALVETRSKYESLIAPGKLGPDTPLKIGFSDGRSIMLPAQTLINRCIGGVDILRRQVFVMLYGSLETFLFDLIARSFTEIGITENILDLSLEIMMKKKWDGRFCKMRDLFELPYEAGDMMNHFKGFQMEFEGKVLKNPISFLDELAQIRHRIIHASSILEGDKLIFVNADIFHAYCAFCALLTDYIDGLFAKRFAYTRVEVDPAKA
jgi:hypothetical protein